MSEQGWRAFLAAEDLDDWVVVHGGAVAAFRIASLEEGTATASAIAAALGPDRRGALLTITDDLLTIRLCRDLWQLEAGHIASARIVSAVARERGCAAERSAVQEVQVAIAAKLEGMDVGFWRAVLGYSAAAEDNAVDPLGHGSTVWMQEIDSGKALRHAMHIDVSVAREQVPQRLAAALAAGGRVVDDSHAPSHWTLSDRAGNRVCICGWPDGFVAGDGEQND